MMIKTEENKGEKTGHKNNPLKSFLAGAFLGAPNFIRELPFILFLAFLAFLYIGVRYRAENLAKNTSRLKNEIKELRYESISLASELMYSSNRSEVKKMIKQYDLDLVESKVPPKKIVIKK
jgi:hypothetical protein